MNPSARSYAALFWTVAVVGAVLDIGTKYLMFAWLEPGQERVIIPHVFSLVHQDQLNQGALFGLGRDHGSSANWMFAAFSGAAILVIIFWARKPASKTSWVLSLALGLILAGAIGNLYDRMHPDLQGVRDFLWFYYRSDANDPRTLAYVKDVPMTWPVFNFADTCLVCGAALLLLHAFLSKSDESAQTTPTQPEAAKAQAS